MKIALVHFAFDRLDVFRDCFEQTLRLRPKYLDDHHYVFLDGSNEKRSNLEVRHYLRTKNNLINLIERPRNIGLRENILMGITEISEKYDAFIVLEDDLLISEGFFEFMRVALLMRNEKTGHISAWNYPGMGAFNRTYSSSIMNCWGWATWSDIWREFIVWYEAKNYEKSSKEELKKMNFFWLSGFLSQYEKNLDGTLKTWAIFWYLFLISCGYNTYQPFRSLVLNIGLSNGTNTTMNPDIFVPRLYVNSSHRNSKIFDLIGFMLLKCIFFLRLFKKVPRLIYGKISRL